MKPMIFLVVAAALLWAASTYWSPYHSCVRALVAQDIGRGETKTDAEAFSALTCAKFLKVE